MRKLVIIISSFLFLLILVLIPDPKNEINPPIEYSVIEEKKEIYVYYFLQDRLVGIPCSMESDNPYTLIHSVFEYLASRSNSVKEEYKTVLNLSSKLVSYQLQDKKISLEVSDDFFRIEEDAIPKALAQIYYSYTDLGYETIYLMNQGKIINQLGDCLLANGIKGNLAVNIDCVDYCLTPKTIKVEYLYPSKMKSFTNFLVKPTEDKWEFMIQKILNFYNATYHDDLEIEDYHFENNTLTVKFKKGPKNTMIIQELLQINFEIEMTDILFV